MSEVIGGHEVGKGRWELVVALVVEAFDSRFLDGSVHPLDLAVSSRMVRPFDFAQQPYCRSSGIGMPWSIVGEHGIGGRDEFAHGGDDGNLGRFSLFAQVFVEGADGRIAADGDNRCHIKAAPRRHSAASDMCLPT